MQRARNGAPEDIAPVVPELRKVAGAVLAFDPAMHLLLGPHAVRTLKKVERAEPVTIAELVVLGEAIDSASKRGIRMLERLSEKQIEQLMELAEISGLLGAYIILVRLPPEEAARVVERFRRENPVAEATITLEPTDENAIVLAERVVGLYEPVFRWEPQIKVIKDVTLKGKLHPMIVTLSGDEGDVIQLVETLRLTLGANAYRGTFDADVRTAAPAPNPTRLRNSLLR